MTPPAPAARAGRRSRPRRAAIVGAAAVTVAALVLTAWGVFLLRPRADPPVRADAVVMLAGAEPLSPAESDHYVRQCAAIAHLHGARTSPTTVRELEQLLRSARGRARATAAGRTAAATLRSSARPCPGVVDTSVTAHRQCVTVVDAAAGLVPSDVRRALALPHRPMDRTAVFGRITRAHEGLGRPMLTTRAPIAAPSALRARPR